MPSIISATTTNGLSTSADNSGSLQLATNNGTTAVTIDTSQNVGIGTSSPATKLHVTSTITSVGDANANFLNGYANSGDTYSQLSFWNNAGSNNNGQIGVEKVGTNGGLMYFKSKPDGGALAERMRIASNGQITVTADGGTGIGPLIRSVTGSTNGWRIGNYSAIVGGGSNDSFTCANSGGGGVFISGASGTSWSAVSDERVKENLTPITDAVNKVSTLRSVIGNYTWDADKTPRPFLIAQDVQAVLPEAVSQQNDELGTLGISYTEVIPLLVASIKELKATVDAQAVRIAELEGAK